MMIRVCTVLATFGLAIGSTGETAFAEKKCPEGRPAAIVIHDDDLTTGNNLPNESVSVCEGKRVVWIFVNETDKEVDVRLSDFKIVTARKAAASNGVEFEGNTHGKGTVPPKGTLLLRGKPKDRAPNDVKYTVFLKAGGPEVSHDPLLKITDPDGPRGKGK